MKINAPLSNKEIDDCLKRTLKFIINNPLIIVAMAMAYISSWTLSSNIPMPLLVGFIFIPYLFTFMIWNEHIGKGFEGFINDVKKHLAAILNYLAVAVAIMVGVMIFMQLIIFIATELFPLKPDPAAPPEILKPNPARNALLDTLLKCLVFIILTIGISMMYLMTSVSSAVEEKLNIKSVEFDAMLERLITPHFISRLAHAGAAISMFQLITSAAYITILLVLVFANVFITLVLLKALNIDEGKREKLKQLNFAEQT